ncbi:hypothetical protein ASD28_17385 [Massilia sp. Root133]|uniref:hypothetical protein n=1 Tax=unclassified Massilia TaxID=2609279 RepID=UPI0006F64F45|nr:MULTISPECIES: hypothetical protein [unclassified Massilia]KQX96864.1 hypothetical protein ASD28_17385 [Massilia sp. Root133]KQZ52572.1 hypothetical protein ASD92_18815 [Massilia sp. Root1485]
MAIGQVRVQGKEQRRVTLRPAAFDETDLDAARLRPQGQAQRRRRGVLPGRQRTHHEEQGFPRLRGQVQAAQVVGADIVLPEQQL